MRNLKNQIRLFKPSVGKEEINSFKEILKGPWLGYGFGKEFQVKFSNYWFQIYYWPKSCTVPLHIALAVNKFKKKKSFSLALLLVLQQQFI